jgi:hypothetical protein
MGNLVWTNPEPAWRGSQAAHATRTTRAQRRHAAGTIAILLALGMALGAAFTLAATSGPWKGAPSARLTQAQLDARCAALGAIAASVAVGDGR